MNSPHMVEAQIEYDRRTIVKLLKEKGPMIMKEILAELNKGYAPKHAMHVAALKRRLAFAMEHGLVSSRPKNNGKIYYANHEE